MISEIPTINAYEIGFSGFGVSGGDTAVGYCGSRKRYGTDLPIAVFVQMEEDAPSVCVYFGIDDDERDSSDINPFRQYKMVPGPNSTSEDILYVLGLMQTLKGVLQGKTINQMDYILVRNYKAVRIV